MHEKEMKNQWLKISWRNICCVKGEGAAVKKKEDTHKNGRC